VVKEMQQSLLNEFLDLSEMKVLIGLSGGVNSMAVLCYLATVWPKERRPRELHLFYAHFAEHSPDTFKFVLDGIFYAENHYEDVHVSIRFNSVLRFFRNQKMIPHPTVSPCTRKLKIEPIEKYIEENDIDLDLIGYVTEEKKRISRQIKKGASKKFYPISSMQNEECFDLVDREIGWHPAIYDLRKTNFRGRQVRAFAHNNCLPCKNSSTEDLEQIRLHFPNYFAQAETLELELGQYWGRDSVNKCDSCEHMLFELRGESD
jgi:3'-phosphoadenosine 5'-phosphosulfate sulfotransferase (PAPS reductase)/FAD synthetase